MDRRELEYIIVIAQEKNLSKAAERLYVSQPALSRFLLKLETQAGLPLFERKKRQLVPTLAGELYLDTARKMLQLDQDLERQLKKLRECTHGKLTIGITPGRGHTVLPRVLPDFQEKYPDYELTILEEDVQTLEQQLQADALDLAFLPCPNPNGRLRIGFAVSASPRKKSFCVRPKMATMNCWQRKSLGEHTPGST